MRTVFDLGPLPSIAQVEAVWDATVFSYEAGDFPDGMDEFTASFVEGDGGLLNTLAYLRRALELLEVERSLRMAEQLEPWHGKA